MLLLAAPRNVHRAASGVSITQLDFGNTMQGQASYLWPDHSPRLPIYRVVPGLYIGLLLSILGFTGCGSSSPEAQPTVAEQQEMPAIDLKSETAPVDTKPVAEKPAAEEPEQSIEQVPERPPITLESKPRMEQPDAEEREEPTLLEPVPLPAPENAVRLSPTEEVWINRDEHRVYVGGQVVLRRGMLEMFACTKGTKEHESVVSVNSLAATVHAALLAVGAVPGTPVSYDTEYHPPTGTEIDIQVEWKDPAGKWRAANAREWVRNVRTNEELATPWVFAGSGFYVDEETKKQHYLAESGDLVCVSNFGSATLDLPVESSQAEAGLMFEAFTDRIPALGTPVRLVMTPKLGP